MKLFAVVPALLVLISLCGSPVPPPPGSVSGTVFYDANHNGVHDSCDSPLSGVNVQATGSDGKTETATGDADGSFRIPGTESVAYEGAAEAEIGVQKLASCGTRCPKAGQKGAPRQLASDTDEVLPSHSCRDR